RGKAKKYLDSLGLKGGSDDSLRRKLELPAATAGKRQFVEIASRPGVYPRLFVQRRTFKLPAETAGTNLPRCRFGLCQLRGRSVRSRPSCGLEPTAGEVRKDHEGVGNQHRKYRQ